jgi:hypothetical protein
MEVRKLLLSALVAVGCKAQPTVQSDGALHDLASVDSAGEDLSSGALDGAADLACPAGPVEICGNGCDDDRNGYTDDDDPACTPQLLATWQGGSSALQRLLLRPPFSVRAFDMHAVSPAAHPVYNRAFADVAFVALDGSSNTIVRLPAGGAPQPLAVGFNTRDVCVFNGELIVVDARGLLHRLKSDAQTPSGADGGVVQLAAWKPLGTTLLTACATDGQHLYVAEHAGAQPSKFDVLDTSFSAVSSAAIPIPDTLLNDGYDRCVDFAWTRGGFYGLFAASGGELNDSNLFGQILAPFSLDGSVGPPVDAGYLHGVGEFTP